MRRSQHLSYQLKIDPKVDFFLREDKKAIGFKAGNLADYQTLRYEIIYDSENSDKGITGQLEINQQNEISRENLILGTCSGIEGKVCVYDEGITKLHLKVTLFSDSEQAVLEKEISY